VEYRLREVIQDACKFMRHSKRAQLSTEDVNSSLRLRNVESLYGFPAGAGPIAFAEVPGQPGLFYQEQTEIELKARGDGGTGEGGTVVLGLGGYRA
jgi:transcription initiation factor TFIID subunit 6